MLVERTCIATRTKYDKNLLVRIVKIKDGTISIDINHDIQGRGAYFYPTIDNVLVLKKRKLLNRALRCNVSGQIYNELEVYINGKLS